jgi:hypothetical protein
MQSGEKRLGLREEFATHSKTLTQKPVKIHTNPAMEKRILNG